MAATPDAYYETLSGDYGRTIRQLVPRYDEMVEETVSLLALEDPRAVLDLGAGPGIVAERTLDALPGARLTAVDVSTPMLARAAERLGRFGDRVSLIEADLADFRPEGPFDAVVSTLVLHNLPEPAKRALLARTRGAMAPRGVLLWADMIRFEDERLQRRVVELREAHARRHGCPEPLLAWNFAKEGGEDFPLTVEGTLRLAREAGFGSADVAWTHDAFALVRCAV